MSKSYGNAIEIFESEKSMRKKIMRIVTDSTPVEEPKNPDTCNVFALFKLFAVLNRLLHSKPVISKAAWAMVSQDRVV
jgi:tryptophanyl-tRNA synthetase